MLENRKSEAITGKIDKAKTAWQYSFQIVSNVFLKKLSVPEMNNNIVVSPLLRDSNSVPSVLQFPPISECSQTW